MNDKLYDTTLFAVYQTRCTCTIFRVFIFQKGTSEVFRLIIILDNAGYMRFLLTLFLIFALKYRYCVTI